MISADDDCKVVLDACVLYPQTLRDLLLRLALAGLYAARFSERILEEVRSNLVSDGRATEANASRMIALIRANAEECIVDASAALPPDLRLPDPNDVHVVQTAVAVGAAQILTFNVGHFPPEELAKVDLELAHPDEFLFHLCDLYPSGVVNVCHQWFAVLRKPPRSAVEMCNYLYRNQMPRAAEQFFRLLH
jgi:predicted nucleic acid-binding protein